MALKSFIKKYDTAIYPINLWVGIAEDFNTLLEKFTDIPGNKVYDETEAHFCGATYHSIWDRVGNEKAVLIALHPGKCYNLGLVAHESKHAADRIYDSIGESDTKSEPHAYLTEWIFNKVLETKKLYDNENRKRSKSRTKKAKELSE